MKFTTTSTILAILAAAYPAIAGPVNKGYASGTVATEDDAHLFPPSTTAAPSPYLVRRAIKELTVTVSNNMKVPIATRHARTCPDELYRRVRSLAGDHTKEGGRLQPGESHVVVLPRDYIGAIFANDARFPTSQHCTQFELSLTGGKIAFDVSNVTGWTVPMVCKCGGDNNKVFSSGCNKDLRKGGHCPNWLEKENACANPYRDNSITKVATPFFKACEGKSYTFVNDHAAIRHDLCKQSTLTCCIGEGCPE